MDENEVRLLVVINGSPFEEGKGHVRRELAERRAREVGAPVAYVNMWGGQDDLVFDGQSFIVGADGTLLATAPAFTDALLVWDLPASDDEEPHKTQLVTPLEDDAEVYWACVTGLRDYVRKNGMSRVTLGLSGGIDSALAGDDGSRRAWGRRTSSGCPCRRGTRPTTRRTTPPPLAGEPWDRVPDRRDRADGRGIRGGASPDGCRGGEHPGAGAGHDPHGDLQLRGAARARHGQQERTRDRVLDRLRRRRRRLRPAQGRRQVPRVGPRPVAQPLRRVPRPAPAHSGQLHREAPERGTPPRTRPTRTASRPTTSSTRCSTPTSSTPRAARS